MAYLLLLPSLVRHDAPQTPLDRIEGKPNRLIHPCGRQAALPGHASAQGRRCADSGRTIHAIKLYRDENPGAGLHDGKEAIAALQRWPSGASRRPS